MIPKNAIVEDMNKITIQVNGESMQVTVDVKSVADLIEKLNLSHRRFFIIEKNRAVISPENYQVETVSADDCFEIVHFVGGG